MTDRDVRERLRALGLVASAEALDDLIALATKKRWGPIELFEYVIALEDKDRAQRGLDRRLKRSRLERDRPSTRRVRSAPRVPHRAEKRRARRSAGLGQNHDCPNFAHNAVLGGHGVLFISAAQLLLDLGAQESARALERRLKYYAKVGLLIIDEIGF